MASAKDLSSQVFWLSFYVCGVIGMLLVYGLMQERIMQRPYSGEVFSQTHSVLFLVLLIRGAGAIFALFVAGTTGENLVNGAEMWKYLCVALALVASGICSYGAIRYVSFGVQALGKSFKMMPVMLWSLAISGKRYGLADWVVSTLVTGGVTEFMLTGPTASSNSMGSSVWGLLLLVGAIMMDGFTLSMQEKIFVENKTTKYNQMMYVNGMAALVALCTLVLSGELVPALRFSFSHSNFLRDAISLSAAFVGAQYFKYSLVKEFGALVFAASMNFRQVLSILASYVAYHHHLTAAQGVGLTAVFGALLYRSAANLAAPKDA